MTIEGTATPVGELLADLADEPLTIEIPDASEDLGAGDDNGSGEGTETGKGEGEGGDADSEPAAGDKEPKAGEGKTDEDEGAKEPEAEPERKKLSGAQRSRARIEALEAEVAKLRGTVKPEAEVKADREAYVAKRVGAEPKEEDYSDFLEFDRARTIHGFRKAAAEDAFNERVTTATEQASAKEAEIVEAHKARFVELGQEHASRLDKLEKAIPGSVAKIQGAKDLTASRTVAELLLESEKSHLLQLHFVEHPEKLAELNAMSEREAARTMGRLEARLHLPKPKTETKAPAPLRAPTGGASPSSPSGDLDAWLSQTYGG